VTVNLFTQMHKVIIAMFTIVSGLTDKRILQRLSNYIVSYL